MNGRAVDKRCTMIWLFEETEEGSEEFVQSCRPALPSRGVDVERIEGIDRNMGSIGRRHSLYGHIFAGLENCLQIFYRVFQGLCTF